MHYILVISDTVSHSVTTIKELDFIVVC